MVEAALQMAGAFTTATATLLLRTGAAPRWLTLSGTIISVLLFVLSLYILVAARRESIPAVL